MPEVLEEPEEPEVAEELEPPEELDEADEPVELALPEEPARESEDWALDPDDDVLPELLDRDPELEVAPEASPALSLPFTKELLGDEHAARPTTATPMNRDGRALMTGSFVWWG